MFAALPLFLALGFFVGVEWWRDFQDIKNPFTGATDALLQWIGITVVVLLGLAVLPPALADIYPRGLLIAAASLGVGSIAGFWFAKHRESRDRLIFVSGSLLLVFACALEYEIKIFDRMTKFGAGTVNLELSGAHASYDNTPINQLSLSTDQGGPFLGATRVDLALRMLHDLGEYILRDERYAEMFFGAEQLPATLDDFKTVLDKTTLRLAFLACNDLKTAARNFRAAQKLFRTDSPSNPELIAAVATLTKSFSANLDLGKNFDDLEASVRKLNEQSEPLPKVVESLVEAPEDQAKPSTPKEISLCSLFEDSKPGKVGLDRVAGTKEMPEFAPLKNSLSFGYSAHHVAIVALGQFAIGNREGAIQLLDSVIARQKAYLAEHRDDLAVGDGPCKPTEVVCPRNSEENKRRRLNAYRRLVTVARLENIQETLLEAFGVQSIDPVRIRTLQQLADDYGLAFTKIRNREVRDPQMFDSQRSPKTVDSCAAGEAASPLQRTMLTRWSIARAYQIYNMLDIFGKDPKLLNIQWSDAEKFDKYASYIENFDFGCAVPNGVNDLDKRATAQFLRSAGDYWMARAALYAERDEDGVNPGPTITALCRAKADLQKASEQEPKLAPSKTSSQGRLDGFLDQYKNDVQPVLIDAAKRRVKELLRRYSDAERDKYCR